jgi:RNA polymerase sigma-70 factor, ECF subfamily
MPFAIRPSIRHPPIRFGIASISTGIRQSKFGIQQPAIANFACHKPRTRTVVYVMATIGIMAPAIPTESAVLTSTRSRTAVVGELFDEHANGVYRLALTMLHDVQAAEDVVQETFLKLIAHVDRGGALPNARGWLYTVAAHACRDRQRTLVRWLPWVAERDARTARESPDARDGANAVLAAIRTLHRRDRLLVALRAQGLSYQEIAEAAGIQPASVGQSLARALARLDKKLG